MPNPPSGETRLLIKQCPECLAWADVEDSARVCWDYEAHPFGEYPDLVVVEVVPASDLAALQSDLRIARELGNELADAAIAYVANPSPATGQPLGVCIAKWRAALQQLEAGQEQQ